MKSPDNLKPGALEEQRSYKIEHLPGFDVVVNLDYPRKEDQDKVLEILRQNQAIKSLGVYNFLDKITNIRDGSGKFCFFLKPKKFLQKNVDFILGRTQEDPVNAVAAQDLDKSARYALSGVINEIILSKKIKAIIASSEVQKLARQHGFAGMKFAEPIVALIDNKTPSKFLIYENMRDDCAYPSDYVPQDLTNDLREIFLRDGINPHDLRENQFIKNEQNGKPFLVLIDIEAYTRTDNAKS